MSTHLLYLFLRILIHAYIFLFFYEMFPFYSLLPLREANFDDLRHELVGQFKGSRSASLQSSGIFGYIVNQGMGRCEKGQPKVTHYLVICSAFHVNTSLLPAKFDDIEIIRELIHRCCI